MVIRTRAPWALVAISIWMGGCEQILGLGAYGDAPDGDVADADGGVDGSLSAPGEGGNVGDAFVADTQTSDSSANVSTDAGTAPATCPIQCNSGCDAGTCSITIMSAAGPVTCPPGLPCHVHCYGNGACQTTNAITCASGQPCTVNCEGNPACNMNTINDNGAASLCVQCTGTRGCNFVTCQGATATNCSLQCTSCNASCASCARVTACQ